MKRIFIFAFLGSISLCSNAQTWAFPNSEWYYGYATPGGWQGFVKVTHPRDTTIQGLTCQVMHAHSKIVDQFAGKLHEIDTNYFTCEKQNGLVLILHDGTIWDTLFNMNALPGDHWNFTQYQSNRILVVDTGHSTLQGVSLRWLAIKYVPVMPGIDDKDTIYERIGPVGNYTYSTGPPTIDQFPHGVCSYSDSNIADWPKSDSYCSYLPTIGVKNPQLEAENLIITRANGSCQIQFLNLGKSTHISVYSIAGQLISSSTNTSLELPSLPCGVYFVKGIRDNISISRKFIIAD